VTALRGAEAIRLGLRAAMRNPELSFGKALVDLGASLLSLLPVILVGLLLAGAVDEGDLFALFEGLRASRWPLLGAVLAALALSFTAGAAFWAGALPTLAADAEMGARPPPGTFSRLAIDGFPRVAIASALGMALVAVHAAAGTLAIVAGAWQIATRPSAAVAALFALAVAVVILGAFLVDLLGRLVVARAAVLGETATAAFSGAARLLGARPGACLGITLAFFGLELVVATGASTLGTSFSASVDLDQQLLALPARLAASIAGGVVLAWLEVARQGALAILAANDAGLLEPPGPAEPPWPRVIEALPVAEPVIEALPVDPPRDA